MIPDRLQPVIEAKLRHIAERKKLLPLADVEERARSASPPRGFAAALRARVDTGRYALIAEIKRASPSRGLIRADFDPTALARAYQAGGAACLSVLTDVPFFQGDDQDLIRAREAVSLPVLRKDFIVDPYQVTEARMLGADCILLIMAALDDGRAAELKSAAEGRGMDVLMEVHDEAELQRALRLSPTLIGINNRNLKTLAIDLSTSINLACEVPTGILVVGESGLATPANLARLYQAGISSFLVGESLLRHEDVKTATEALLVDRS